MELTKGARLYLLRQMMKSVVDEKLGTHSTRCPTCGRFILEVDRLEAEASDWRVEAAERHVHVPRSHRPQK